MPLILSLFYLIFYYALCVYVHVYMYGLYFLFYFFSCCCVLIGDCFVRLYRVGGVI